MRAWARHFGTLVAGSMLLASLGVAVLGGLRLARGEANAGLTLLAGMFGLAVGGIMLRARPELRTSAAAAITAVGVALVGTEAFLAWRIFAGSSHADVPNFDTRSALEVVRDLQAEGTPAVPVLLSSYARASGSELVPLGGLPDSTTVFCNESGEWVIYPSDPDGFNNPPGEIDEVEFVVLGDSFAHGQCVTQGKDVAGQLRARGYGALNFGSAGTGPLSALGALLEYGLAVRPKTVLWFYYEGNDPLDLEAELRTPTLARYLEGAPHQDLRARRADVEAYWRRYLASIPDPGRSAVIDPIEIARSVVTLRRIRRIFALTNTFPNATPASLRKVLSEGVAAAEKAGAEIVFVYIPSSARLDDVRFKDHRDQILAVATGLGLRTIDFAETVASHPDPKSLYPNRGRGHFDEDGYRLLTDTILRCLASPPSNGARCH